MDGTLGLSSPENNVLSLTYKNLAALLVDEGEYRNGNPGFIYAEISDEMAETVRHQVLRA